jgi:hypothetical protein
MITHTIEGVVYARQSDVLDQLGPDVTADMLRKWARRHGVGKVNVGREVWYDLTAAIEAEHRARASGRGRIRRRRDRQ